MLKLERSPLQKPEKSSHSNEDPAQPKINKYNYFSKIEKNYIHGILLLMYIYTHMHKSREKERGEADNILYIVKGSDRI